MCGIAGLLITDPDQRPQLGALLAPIFEAMTPRGPDSAGLALYGDGVEVHKQVGPATKLTADMALADRGGTCGIAHTRMATESAVTTEGCHPFMAGDDVGLVHNGSFSNYATVRRDLAATGVSFDSDNDSEVCCRLLAEQLAAGAGLAEALGSVPDRMDGFYTLLVATPSEMAILRDPAGCKPAVVAEGSGWVAVASEYHALSELPGIDEAHVFEPAPLEVHTWRA
ncbi:MAG: class II glutamine amidotransferase [Acidimicrobiia bacterium]|nr:class II glutamine amidotransferase [Acidimicrobiia bacterium]